jgi:EAL domain-containing protein (putative c-di-GMP-specific phosphodiesterase class I)/uncharacterized caspase-like protein
VHNAFAVLIGINRYQDSRHLLDLRFAEKDCSDMRDALCAHPSNAFKRENVLMLTGAAATTEAIEQALYKGVVKERSADDFVIVYFSGHGFIATDEHLPYIASHDVSINALMQNPGRGLRMDRLHDDYFVKSPARRVLLILDCCHSGSITPGGPKGTQTKEIKSSLVPPNFLQNSRGRLALVSCPPESVSRESHDLENGVFTHFLVRGLLGEAAEPETGEVTVDSLLAYTRRRMPSEQPPGSYGEHYGRLVITSPGIKQVAEGRASPTQHRVSVTNDPELLRINAPLDAYTESIAKLISLIQGSDANLYPDSKVLGAILNLAGADQAVVVREGVSNFTTTSRVVANPGDKNVVRRAGRALETAIDGIGKIATSKSFYHNVVLRPEVDDGNAWVVIGCVPVRQSAKREYLFLSGVNEGSAALDDVFMHIGLCLYLASNGLTSTDSEHLEASLLDNLKEHYYQHVPFEWYQRRFDLFRKRLKSIVFHFQPVLCLQPKSLYISAWEALARDRDTGHAPVDAFHAGEIWGTRFMTELDLYCAEGAICGYMDALREAKMQRPLEIPDLCINVYPSTLMRDVFMRKLEELLLEHPLRRRLVLEISEKLPLPPEAADLNVFRERLELYVKNLEVIFAIDDFGVGYSSVERLARLAPSYVKIDREVLHLQTGDHAIRYVLDVTSSKRLSPSKVVIEGFDGDSDISLAHLYALGIRYVQGFTIGKAGPALYRIRKEDAKFLEALLVDRIGARA